MEGVGQLKPELAPHACDIENKCRETGNKMKKDYAEVARR